MGTLTERAQRSIDLAREEAQRLQYSRYIGTENLLMGILSQEECTGAKVLACLGVSLEMVGREAVTIVNHPSYTGSRKMQYTPVSLRVIDSAFEEARGLCSNHVGTEHILLAIMRERESLGAKILAELGVASAEVVMTKLKEIYDSTSPE